MTDDDSAAFLFAALVKGGVQDTVCGQRTMNRGKWTRGGAEIGGQAPPRGLPLEPELRVRRRNVRQIAVHRSVPLLNRLLLQIPTVRQARC
jgi:hypothetical protein